ncbi:MAG TPA: DUF2079 domain-containing protein [Candidatus Dormibacteraeota bacterium]|nr:DUF2079 domain-containing protein [Candidatus Dormibacteraeota bacterium]
MYFALYSTLSILRHRTYHSFGFDLGLYDQVFWNTTQGRILESTMTGAMPIPHSQLGDHFTPIYLLVVPLYFAYPHPETLLVVQTLVIALGAWPIFLLARHLLGPGYALLWVVVYFLFIPLAYINLYDFHETAFSIAPLGFALYFIERGQKRRFLIALLIGFLVKEEMSLIGAGFGLYALLGKRDWKLGIPLFVASLATFVAIVQLVIPYFNNGISYSYIALRYGAVGGSPIGIIRTAVTDPLRIARAVAQAKKLYFVVAIFGPVLGLSALAGWAAILVLPTLSYTLLSGYDPQYSFTSQYSAPIIPLVIGTSIIALARLPQRAHAYLAAGVVVSTLMFSWAYGDMPYSRKFNWSLFQAEPRYAAFLPSLDQISPDARVSAENGLPSHLSERRYIYDYTFEGVQDADWVVLDYEGTNYDIELFNEQVAKVEAQGYTEVANGYGLALLRRS